MQPQAMLLQSHTGFKPVPTVLSKNELCREAGLEVKHSHVHG